MRIPIEFVNGRHPFREPPLGYPLNGGHYRNNSGMKSNLVSEEPEEPFVGEQESSDIGTLVPTRSSHEPQEVGPADGNGTVVLESELWKGRYTRLLANFENYKRNTQAERMRFADAGKEAVLEDVFPIIDAFDRAFSASKVPGCRKGLREGIELVREELLKAFQKHGVHRIRTVGNPFDPKLHEAVAVVNDPEHPENTVITEMRAGFTMGDRLLRPAQVVVSRRPRH